MLRETDSMSIGELEEFLRDLPPELKHLPVKILDPARTLSLAQKNINITDGKRYFSLQSLKGRSTFAGMYMELYGE